MVDTNKEQKLENETENPVKTINDFYKSIENKKSYNDKFFENKHQASFISNKYDENNKDTFIPPVDSMYAKEPFIDQMAVHGDITDRGLVHEYLVEQRKLSPKLVDYLIDHDLVRSHDTKNYKYIEFAWKKPANEEESNKFSTKSQKVIGSDRMYFERDDNGQLKRAENGKRITKNSASNYGFNMKMGTGKDFLYVFEAPVDAISYANMYGKQLKGSNSTLLSLSGVSKSNAIQNYLSKQYAKNYDFKKIILCVDNDKAGRKMIGSFSSDIIKKEESIKKSNKYLHQLYVKVPPVKKDWNDVLKVKHDFRNGTEVEPDLINKLYDNTTYDIHDYMTRQTKLATSDNLHKKVLKDNINSLNNLYEKFNKNHDINFYSKEYSNYEKSLYSYDKKFTTYMDTFGKNMHPNELKKYVENSMNDKHILPNERHNINRIIQLRQNGQITESLDMAVRNSAYMSQEGLEYLNDEYQKFNEQHKSNKLEKEHKNSDINQYDLSNVDLKGTELFYKDKKSYIKASPNDLSRQLNTRPDLDSKYAVKYPSGIITDNTPGKQLADDLKNKGIDAMYKDAKIETLRKIGMDNASSFVHGQSEHITEEKNNHDIANKEIKHFKGNSQNNNGSNSFKERRGMNAHSNMIEKAERLENKDITKMSPKEFKQFKNKTGFGQKSNGNLLQQKMDGINNHKEQKPKFKY